MSKEKKKVPEIRFGDFTEDWEQRKCGDILNERNVQHPQSKEFPLVSFTVEDGVTPKTDRYEREQLVRGDKKAKKYKETRLNDIVYNPANLKFGAIARNKYGDAVFSPIYVTYEVDESKALPEFMEMVVTRDSFIQKALQFQQGTVYERMAVNTEDFANLEVQIPSLNEQRKIGCFFEQLDSALTLHQRKLAKLQSLKSAMLVKMFPEEGEKVPEIRFKGFTDAWEQRKFSDVFTSLQNNTLSRAELNDESGVAQNIHYGDVLIKYDEVLDVSKEPLSYIEKRSVADKFKASYLQNGDVIIADTAEDETVGKCTEIADLTDEKIISGLHTMPIRPNEKFASGYLGFYMNSTAYHDQLKPLMQGIKVTSISRSAMQDTIVKYPVDSKEQAQIGGFFLNLDHLITLHQRKLKKLQQIKKALLQKMFISTED